MVARTYRIYKGLSEGLDAYAEKQDLSSNAALNRLLKIALESVGIEYEESQESQKEPVTDDKPKTQKKASKRRQKDGNDD